MHCFFAFKMSLTTVVFCFRTKPKVFFLISKVVKSPLTKFLKLSTFVVSVLSS